MCTAACLGRPIDVFQIALHFVEDKNARFDLAVKCGNLDVALEMATAIDVGTGWPSRLSNRETIK